VSGSLAIQIIAAASRDRPADTVLREKFRAQLDLMPADKAAISRTVFNYFRWRGWLNPEQPLDEQIRRARELAATFARDPTSFSDADLVARVAPAWLREEMDVSPAWSRAIQAEPKLWLRAQPGQATRLCENLGDASPAGGAFPDAVRYYGDHDLFQSDEFHAGEFEIQDIASQAVGRICDPKPGEKWWDACAGEGGKTLHLSALMQNQGLIWASDRAAWRLQSLKRRAARAKVFNFRAAAWDGGAKLPTKTKFDGILVDAPCSGTGTWQRNPHARWTTTPQDVKELAEIQQRLLGHAVPVLKPGGKLIYAVCTLTKAETAGVAKDFTARFPDFEPLVAPDFNASRTIWPQELGGNGMFMAGWRRKP